MKKIKKILICPAVQKELGDDFEDYVRVLREFLKNPDGHGFNFEKLHGKLGKQKLSSIRAGGKPRLILSRMSSDKEGAVMAVTSVLRDHDYNDANPLNPEEQKALANGDEKKFLVVENTGTASPDAAEDVVEVSNRIEFINNQFVLFDEGQQRAKEKGANALPLIISGAPGSGKSSVLLSILRQNMELWCNRKEDEPFPKILVLAKSSNLIEKMAQDWTEIYNKEFQYIEHLIPRNCVEFKTPEMIYKEAHPDALFSGEDEFIDWYQSYASSKGHLAKPAPAAKNRKKPPVKATSATIIGAEQAPLIYQEFHTMSGYESFKDYYESVSTRFSLFPDEKERAVLWEVFQDYKANLQKHKLVDLTFLPIELPASYRFVGVDETQDLSCRQIRSLVQEQVVDKDSLQQHNLLFNVGDHQRLFGSETTIPFIKSMFRELYENKVTVSQETLLASYRCTKKIITMANAVLQLKYKAIGGSIAHDKNELSFIRARDVEGEEVEEDIAWIDDESSLEKLIARQQNNAKFVVITPVEFLEEAELLFGAGRVFTTEQFKGLEANDVLLYRPLDQEGFQAANKVVGPDFVLSSEGSLTKDSDNQGNIRHSSLFNQLFVAVTRAQSSLTFYQPKTKNRHAIKDSLHRFCIEQKTQSTFKEPEVIESTREEWLEQAKKLRQQNLNKQAEAIERQLKDADTPSAPVTEPQTNTPTQPVKGKTKTPSKKPKKRKGNNNGKANHHSTHVLEQLIQDPALVLKKIIQHVNVKNLLFHTPLNTINPKLPQMTFFQYLRQDTEKSRKLKKQFFSNLASLVEESASAKTPSKQLDVLSGLLHFVPNDAQEIESLSYDLLQELPINSKGHGFVQNYFRSRTPVLINKVVLNHDISSMHSLMDLGMLNAFDIHSKATILLRLIAQKPFNLGAIKAFINLGPNLNMQDAVGMTAVSAAAGLGYPDVLKALLAAGANFNIACSMGMTPLIYAIHSGSIESVRVVLSAKPNIAAKADLGYTALHAASSKVKSPAMIREIISACKSMLNVRNDKGETALFLAVTTGNLEMAQALIDAGADVNIENNDGESPLFHAVEEGHVEMTKLLLRAKAKIKPEKEKGYSPLHTAIILKNRLIIQALIDARKDILDLQNNLGDTALYLAAELGFTEAVQMLIDAGANINLANHQGYPPIFTATSIGYPDIIKALLKANAKTDIAVGETKSTLLHLAASSTKPDVLRELIGPCKNLINAQTANGEAPLHFAAQYGNSESVEVLIAADADINIRNNNQVTPLFTAIRHNKKEVVAALLRENAKYTQTNEGHTDLHAAASNNNPVLYSRELVAARKDIINFTDNKTQTALYLAAGNGQIDMLEALIDEGADLNLSSSQNFTPLFYACRFNHPIAVAKLLEKGADFKQAGKTNGKIIIEAATQSGADAIIRARNFIDNYHLIDSKEEILISPLEISKILGHIEIVRLIEDKIRETEYQNSNPNRFFSPAPEAPSAVAGTLVSNDQSILSAP